MTRKHLGLIIGAVLALLLIGGIYAYRLIFSQINVSGLAGDGGEAGVRVPPGFSVNVFVAGLDGPRFIAFGPDGTLYAAERGAGRIVALPDGDGDGRADGIAPFAAELERPHSLAFHEGAWYVGVPSGVVRLVDGDGDGSAETREVIIDDYPTAGAHSTRTVAFLPDGRMVVSIGSSCNVCVETDPRRAAVVVYDGPDGANERILARGLRNAVGLAVHPQSGALWATNNGRDLMSDDLPPETIYVVRDGADYGWPTCHSGDVPDPDLGGPGACDGVEQPVAEMTAHSAPLGMAFYTGTTFPEAYHDDLFIALHGSWNRSEPVGYSVVRLPLDGSAPAGAVEEFAAGWRAESGEVRGRPVGLAVGPDGALYVSDDRGGLIYRIQYGE
jgi:glucose/arabinose dehydrogenase